jgi:glycerol-3-phosphate O-acyltransferase 3/4
VLLRYLFLLPLRIAIVAAGYALIYPPFFALKHGAPQTPAVLRVQQTLVTAMCRVWLTAWAAAVRYRGPRPSFTPGHVWVANHTSMIDFHILAAHHPFACLMQQHVGALGWVQRHVWSTIGCINFDRQGVSVRSDGMGVSGGGGGGSDSL